MKRISLLKRFLKNSILLFVSISIADLILEYVYLDFNFQEASSEALSIFSILTTAVIAAAIGAMLAYREERKNRK